MHDVVTSVLRNSGAVTEPPGARGRGRCSSRKGRMLGFYSLHPNFVLTLCRSFWAGLGTARSCPLGRTRGYNQLEKVAEPWHAQDNPSMVLGQLWDSPGTLSGCGLGGYKGVSAAVAQLGEKEEKEAENGCYKHLNPQHTSVTAARALVLHPRPPWGVFGDTPTCTPCPAQRTPRGAATATPG